VGSARIGADEEVMDDDWESGSVRSGANVVGHEDSSSTDNSGTEEEEEIRMKTMKTSAQADAEGVCLPQAKSKALAESTFLPSLLWALSRGF